MTSQSFYISTSYLSFGCLQLWPYMALKKYGYVLICSPKSQASILNRLIICFLSKTVNQIPRNYEGWICKGSPTVSPEVANSHQKMAHESPAFLRNQRQSRTAEITARLTGQLPRPPQSYFYNKGIFKTSSSKKIALLTLHKQHSKANEKNAYFLFLCDRSWQNKWQATYCCFFQTLAWTNGVHAQSNEDSYLSAWSETSTASD